MHGHLNVKVCIFLNSYCTVCNKLFFGGGGRVREVHSETKRCRNATVSLLCWLNVWCLWTAQEFVVLSAVRSCIQRQDCKHWPIWPSQFP